MFAEPSRGQDRADKRQKTIMNILVLEKHQHAMALFHTYMAQMQRTAGDRAEVSSENQRHR